MEKIVDFSKLSIKKIRELIVFTALIVVALWKFDVVLGVIKAVWGIIFPFALGGAIAFVINVPMSFLEKKLFGKAKEKGSKAAGKLARPISLLLTIVLVVGVIVLVMFGLIPQLTATIGSLMNSIADFIPQMQSWVREFTHNNREIMDLVNQVEFNPNKAIQWGMSILGNGAGNFMNTTMTAVGSIVSGVTTFFIAFSFACYILFQKEKLHVQVRKVFFAFIPKRKAEVILEVCSLTYRTFANFLTGQCLEAVILGSMFVITLSILKMPYALLIGIIISFTALIPIFGAFIGCVLGGLLIFMVSPKQAILFILVFLILQQIEGNLIYPHVVGSSVGLPSIWVLAAVTIGGNLLGIIGMLIFIPLVSVLYTLFREYVYLRLKRQHIKRVTKTEVEEYTVEEFIDAIADGRNGTHGQITIKNDRQAIESLVYNIESIDYRHCRLQNAEEKIKQVWAYGNWLKINYTILLENKQETQKGALRFIIKKPNGEESVVVIFKNKSDGTYSFVNLTKEHICSCKFKTIEEAIQDMNDQLRKGLIESYVVKGERK